MKKKKLKRMKRGRTFVNKVKRENKYKIVKKGEEEDPHNKSSIRKMGERKKNEREVEKEVALPGWDAAGPFIGPIPLSLISCRIGMCSLS